MNVIRNFATTVCAAAWALALAGRVAIDMRANRSWP
jgi:hypothetical protein